MPPPRFPLYRRSVNGRNWYRVSSPMEMTEVQQVGSRHVVYRMEARAYPEKVRIMELVSMADGRAEPCSAEEFERLLALCR